MLAKRKSSKTRVTEQPKRQHPAILLRIFELGLIWESVYRSLLMNAVPTCIYNPFI